MKDDSFENQNALCESRSSNLEEGISNGRKDDIMIITWSLYLDINHASFDAGLHQIILFQGNGSP
jgi:hypothetical protein